VSSSELLTATVVIGWAGTQTSYIERDKQTDKQTDRTNNWPITKLGIT